jgi:hypothetical protein
VVKKESAKSMPPWKNPELKGFKKEKNAVFFQKA